MNNEQKVVKIMNNEQKVVKYVTYEYVIKEIANSMSDSINKMQEIVANQDSLCKYLEKAEEKEKYTDFVKSLKDANVKYEEQIKVLTYRLDRMNEVRMYLSNSEYDRFASLLLEALGVTNKDGKSLEEREANHEEVKEYTI